MSSDEIELEEIESRLGLLPGRESHWPAGQVPLAERGVSLKWLADSMYKVWRYLGDRKEYLRNLYHGAELRFAENPMRKPALEDDPSPEYLVPHVIRPLTRQLGAPLFARVPPEFRGPPDTFISHSWRQPLVGAYGTLQALESPLGQGAPVEFVWIDIVSYNQHQAEAIAADMKAVLSHSRRLALPLASPEPLNRSWCLWELLCAHTAGAAIELYEPHTSASDLGRVRRLFDEEFTSVESARTTRSEDQQQILEAVRSTFGSIPSGDRFIREVVHAGLSTPRFWEPGTGKQPAPEAR